MWFTVPKDRVYGYVYLRSYALCFWAAQMTELRQYAMRPSGREEAPPVIAIPLDEQIARQAKFITATERAIERNEAKAREYEEEYAALVKQYADGYRETAAKQRTRLADAEAGMLILLQMLPEGRRKYKHGRVTFGITPARESVEITDEEAALTEIKSLGEARAEPLIKVTESIKKKELGEFIRKGDSPGFEYIKRRPGSDSLRRTYPK